MRNILIVVGSANRGGNTDTLAERFAEGAREAGHEVQKVFLGDDIHGCRSCGACQVSRKGCVIKDIMQEIYPLYEKSDTVVLASPVFFATISGQLKAFLDRLYAIGKEDIYPQKDMMLLMTAEDDRDLTFVNARRYYEFINACFGPDAGTYFAGGCCGKPGHHSVPERHLEGAFLLGKNLS
jgi:multimeric flavodoxin WrbA